MINFAGKSGDHVTEQNVVIVELEGGEWPYEWESEKSALGFNDIFCISSNNCFGGDVDGLIDDVIYAISVDGE